MWCGEGVDENVDGDDDPNNDGTVCDDDGFEFPLPEG